MSRIVFDLPEQLGFATEMQIYISHVNQGGHLDNAQLLSLVSEARVRFFKSLGYPEADVGGLSTVVGDIVAQYQSEGFHGETMRVEMAPTDFNRYGFDLLFRMTEKTSGRAVARGKVGIVFVHRSDRKVAPIPDSIRQLLLARAPSAAGASTPL
ncbi:acyl-CoA thioesterase FadM [Acidovorax sp. 62]|uniref:acyl-CoA thioesterase n=1 Tax=unclassified Acidovorax TaxID=2684926 RepID=UPI000C19954F|nr:MULTISPECIES: thioesterase family protein [unclassified Acidovorax]AYM95041.1 thioesterase [Acidovorax sp. 1608163]MCZ8092239.1 thioesterase family protein [Acidovorax sp.]PIF92232.1 acyl-CoA thioesterase FadM [Acidovorax sp. 62]